MRLSLVLVLLASTSCSWNDPGDTVESGEALELLCKVRDEFGFISSATFKVSGDDLRLRDEIEKDWRDFCSSEEGVRVVNCNISVDDAKFLFLKKSEFKDGVRDDRIEIDRFSGRYLESRRFEDGQVHESNGECIKPSERAL